MSDVILEARGLRKAFGGFYAVDGVNLQVREGTIHALIGPNGAGKTTCFNLLSKFLPPTAGSIHLAGRDITRRTPAEVARLGMVRSFQISATFPTMTALENVRLALQRQRGENYDFWVGRKVLRQYEEQARSLLADVGLSELADSPANLLSYGHKRALELATTLALDPRVMLLDEPTAGMTQMDVERIVALIRRIRAGRTIVVVEHNLSVVAGLCDTVTVLTRGTVLTEGDYETVSRDPDVITAYLGSEDVQ
ncbi:MAG: ABC transporter ATP-binding protein [Burkholderiaceae bacterium]|nr:ABC transporter ATP-binding protein [Rhodoferax sp.]MCB2030651.1 ABC transporter ATP-binding protein [Rhodoferax sp.]MCP5264205.1 ABC transporter ATP-binding protein [Rhodoferax sp.]